MKEDDLLQWLRRAQRRTAVIRIMTKPKITSEIHEQALKGVVSLTNTAEVLEALIEERLVVCISPEEKVGRLYGLTKKGAATRRRLCPEEQPYQDIPNDVIEDYVYVVRGKHRTAVIKVMSGRKAPSQIHRDVTRSTENVPPGTVNYVKLSLNCTIAPTILSP